MAGREFRGPAYETARLELARIRVDRAAARSRATRHIAQVSAEALHVERVSVWSLRNQGRKLVCEVLYLRSSGAAESQETLPTLSLPKYLEAIGERRTVVVQDTRHDPRVAELFSSYFEPRGIGSTLDTAIIRDGRVVGIVCHEHVGGPREFDQREIDFSSSVADLFALLLEQADRVELQAALSAEAASRHEDEKMIALGRLARSVAHDINGLLTVVSAVGEGLSKDAPPRFTEDGRKLLSMVELGRKLTQQLLTFGTERRKAAQPLDIVELIESARALLETLLVVRGTLSVELLTSRREVLADATDLQQILLNLVTNARDALREGGKVVVRLREPESADGAYFGMLLLEVEDDGAGMDETTLGRALEPYFTTKESGHGLGLATVFGLVQRFGGQLKMYSKRREGTRVVVVIPRNLKEL